MMLNLQGVLLLHHLFTSLCCCTLPSTVLPYWGLASMGLLYWGPAGADFSLSRAEVWG